MPSAGSISDTFPFINQHFQNPNVPIRCEAQVLKLDPNNGKDLEFEKEIDAMQDSDDRANEITWLEKKDFTGFYSSTDAYKAHKHAYTGYTEFDHETRVEIAKNALKIHSCCCEAFSILAEEADTFDDALSYYLKGIESASKFFNADAFASECRKGAIWNNIPCRSYYRCVLGMANTLRKTLKYNESLKYFKHLLKIENQSSSQSSAFVNPRYSIPDVLLGLKQYKQCQIFLEQNPKEFTQFTNSVVWHYTNALLIFKRISEKEKKKNNKNTKNNNNNNTQKTNNHEQNNNNKYNNNNKNNDNDNDNTENNNKGFNDLIEKFQPFDTSSTLGKTFLEAFQSNLLVPLYLTGKKKLPNVPEKKFIKAGMSWTSAVAYARYHKKHWESIPGALNYMNQAFKITKIKQATLTKDDWTIYLALKESDIDPNLVIDQGISLLHESCYNGYQRCVRYLLSKKVDVNMESSIATGRQTALHMASHNGFVDIVKDLLEHGANIFAKDENGSLPIHYAAYQGEYKAVQLLLSYDYSLVNVKNNHGETPLFAACSSRVHLCINGGPQCESCYNGGSHSQFCSPEECVRILIKHGADVNEPSIQGETPIECALHYSIVGAVRLLKASGAEHCLLSAQNNNNNNNNNNNLENIDKNCSLLDSPPPLETPPPSSSPPPEPHNMFSSPTQNGKLSHGTRYSQQRRWKRYPSHSQSSASSASLKVTSSEMLHRRKYRKAAQRRSTKRQILTGKLEDAFFKLNQNSHHHHHHKCPFHPHHHHHHHHHHDSHQPSKSKSPPSIAQQLQEEQQKQMMNATTSIYSPQYQEQMQKKISLQ